MTTIVQSPAASLAALFTGSGAASTEAETAAGFGAALATLTAGQPQAETATEAPEFDAADVVENATALVGEPVPEFIEPTDLIRSALAPLGVDVPDTVEDLPFIGEPVAEDHIAPGDIVITADDTNAAIYVGAGAVVVADPAQGYVVESESWLTDTEVGHIVRVAPEAALAPAPQQTVVVDGRAQFMQQQTTQAPAPVKESVAVQAAPVAVQAAPVAVQAAPAAVQAASVAAQPAIEVTHVSPTANAEAAQPVASTGTVPSADVPAPTRAPAPVAAAQQAAPVTADSNPAPVAPVAQTAPTAAPAATAPVTPAAPPAPVAHQLTGPVSAIITAGDGEHTMVVRVAPDEFGPVTVRASISGGTIALELVSSTDAGREALKAAMAELRRELTTLAPAASLSLSADGQSAQSQSSGADSRFGGQPASRTERGDDAAAGPESTTEPSVPESNTGDGIDLYV